MVRELKYHERKLLKKVDFINGATHNIKEISIMRQYHLSRYEYSRYLKLCAQISELCKKITALADEPFRVQCSTELVDKLYDMGLIKTKRMKKALTINVKNFARRRLPIFMKQSRMINDAPLNIIIKYIQHGHVRIGPNVITDPASLVTRNHEDFIKWTDKFSKKIKDYSDERDDYVDR